MHPAQIIFILIVFLELIYLALWLGGKIARRYIRVASDAPLAAIAAGDAPSAASNAHEDDPWRQQWLKPVSTLYVEEKEPDEADEQTDQTDSADRPSVSALHQAAEHLEVDRTREAIVDTLVLAGWGTGEIRAQLKGDHGAIGVIVAAARQRLGVEAPPRNIQVRAPGPNGRMEEHEMVL